MLNILKLQGTEKRLYQWVAPLVMNPKVLRQNYNFPFRTDEDFVWYLAFQGRKLLGFVPVEIKRSEYVINNYYTPGRDADMLRQLLQEVIEQTPQDRPLAAIAFLEDEQLFGELGFKEEKRWTRYLKMSRR